MKFAHGAFVHGPAPRKGFQLIVGIRDAMSPHYGCTASASTSHARSKSPATRPWVEFDFIQARHQRLEAQDRMSNGDAHIAHDGGVAQIALHAR